MLQIQETGTISTRIMQLVGHFCQGNKTAFGRTADIQSGVLASIVGGRGSKPGFEILQKLLTAYPTVCAEWLIFGTGPVLKNGDPALALPVIGPFSPNEEQLNQIISQIVAELLENEELQQAIISARVAAKAKAQADALRLIYYVTGPPHADFSDRLSLAARLGISEQAVQHFLGELAIA